MSYNYFQQTIVPSTSAWSIGTVDRPFKDIWVSYGSVNLANKTVGLTGTALSNTGGNISIDRGGLVIVNPATLATSFITTSAGDVTTFGKLSSTTVTITSAGGGVTFPDNTKQTTAYVPPATGTLVGQLTGTWSPVLSAVANGNTFGYTSRFGNFIKIGQLVTATFSIALSSTGTASGNTFIDNLPFPVATGNGVFGSLKCFRYANLDNKVVDVTGGSEGNPGAFVLYHTKNNAAGVTENLTVSELTTTSQLYGTITYIAG
jgi:hypothetical protein